MAAVVAAPKEAKKPELKGKILGIGGILFKSADAKQAREWYGKHLGLADKGEGAILPWLDKGEPHTERMTVWGVFPATTKYFDPGKGSFMVNYIVDDLDALLERLKGEGVKIDPKRQNEAYGRFAWIYDPDGNKIELWQPPAHK
jgi:catechol 2,3-dioxygenase-like lactoylglutathione lyase family enzyme